MVRAFNLFFKNSVESRVLEVIEEKLAVIFKDTGMNKINDVLETPAASGIYEQMMAHVVMENREVDTEVELMIAAIERDVVDVREQSPVYAVSETVDPGLAESLRTHPLPAWVEQMTVCYQRSHGGKAIPTRKGWTIEWPDGEEIKSCAFNANEASSNPDAVLLNLENNRVRGLALNLPQIAAGQPLPCVALSGLPAGVSGYWGLFEIRLQAGEHHKAQFMRIPLVRRGYISVFLSDEGKLFLPTARHIWDVLQTIKAEVVSILGQDESIAVYSRLMESAEQAGRELFNTLQQKHLDSLSREEERGAISFASRRRAIERVGLAEVRQFRLSHCDAEESEWRQELQSARQMVPEIRPLQMMRVMKGGTG